MDPQVWSDYLRGLFYRSGRVLSCTWKLWLLFYCAWMCSACAVHAEQNMCRAWKNSKEIWKERYFYPRCIQSCVHLPMLKRAGNSVSSSLTSLQKVWRGLESPHWQDKGTKILKSCLFCSLVTSTDFFALCTLLGNPSWTCAKIRWITINGVVYPDLLSRKHALRVRSVLLRPAA